MIDDKEYLPSIIFIVISYCISDVLYHCIRHKIIDYIDDA